MATLEILSYPDPRLRTPAKPVRDFGANLSKLIADMKETMYGENGIGLAATQVNMHQRLLVLDVSDERNVFKVYINPELLEKTGTEKCEEGCLSVPGVYADVERAQSVRVKAQNPDGSFFEESLEGLHAVCLQHEMDHLEGVLFVDYLSPLKQRMVRKKLEKQKRQAEKKAATVF
ncbi:MAG TPA: peptide deformylase [Xanthomonadales bacterium]|nr:peptide deformylase [Xanthomonadales bacterium]